MDNRYIHLEWRPELERPVLIAAFTGWNDAAEAASFALATLRESWEAQRFGVFDADEFFDYQTNRPQIKLIEGVTRTIEWPENHLSATAASLEAAGGRGAALPPGPLAGFPGDPFSGGGDELSK